MKKFLKIIGIIFLILIVFMIAAPFLFKDKIIAKIKEEANKNINAKFDFAGLDLSFFRSFPNLSVNIEKLSIVNLAPFDGDTLIYAKDFGLTLDIMSVIGGGEMKILKINIDDPVMNFLVNEKGIANWDVAKPSEPSKPGEPSSFKASLKKYSISNGRILYHDLTMPFLLRLTGVNHTGSGDFTQDNFVLETVSEIKSTDLAYGGIPYINNTKADIKANLDMDMKNMKFTFKDNKIFMNDLELGLNGWIAMPDTNIDMDLTFKAAQSEFKNFLSLIPAVYSESFKDLKSGGTMAFNGAIKGRFNGKQMPGFDVNVNLDKGMFKYPSLPSSVENVFVDLKINNPDGVPDHTLINLSRFHVEMNGSPFDAKLILKTPVSDPDIDAFMKGKIDLGGFSKIMPLDKGTTLTGIITSDLTAKGRLSAIEQKHFDQFNANGNFGISSMTYTSKDSKPVIIPVMLMSFNPQHFSLNSFQAKIGKSDFSANGTLDNVLSYAIKGEKLQGTLNLNSGTIDLNEFMGTEESSTAKTDTSQMAVIDVPANIDFTVNAGINNLIYQDLTISNVKGSLLIKDKAIRMKDVFMQLMDGSMILNGGYSSENIKAPNFDFDMRVKDFDIQKTVTSFPTIAKMAPIAKNCSGKFSVDMGAKSELDQKMSPVMNTLAGAGKLFANNITVSNFPVFNKVADMLKMDSWKKFVLPSVNPSFKFEKGRVYVDPFDINVNGIKATVVGSNGFDETIDYNMSTEIPRSAFGGAANGVLNSMLASANSKGANVNVGDVVPVAVTIGGTVSNPKIGTDLNKSGAKALDALKDKAKEALEAEKAKAEAKAREEADKLKKEGEAKLDAEKKKAQAEADRLKKEAEAKAKAQSDSLKKAAEKKAADKLKSIFKK